MIVEKDSSSLGYPGERCRPLDADHHNVCKFESRSDPGYTSVRWALTNLISSLREHGASSFLLAYVCSK